MKCTYTYKGKSFHKALLRYQQGRGAPRRSVVVKKGQEYVKVTCELLHLRSQGIIKSISKCGIFGRSVSKSKTLKK